MIALINCWHNSVVRGEWVGVGVVRRRGLSSGTIVCSEMSDDGAERNEGGTLPGIYRVHTHRVESSRVRLVIIHAGPVMLRRI